MTGAKFLTSFGRLPRSAEEILVRLDAAAGYPVEQVPVDEALAFHNVSQRYAALWQNSATMRELVAVELSHRISAYVEAEARLEQESPVIDRFEELSGISLQELNAELPEAETGGLGGGGSHWPLPRVREAATQSDRPAASGLPASASGKPIRPASARRGRTYLLVAVVVLMGLAVPLLTLVSRVVTPPAVAWIESESGPPGIRVNAASRGADVSRADATTDANSTTGKGETTAEATAIAVIDSAWTVLAGARHTWLGLFPRYDSEQVARAAQLFEDGSRYGMTDATVRGEAVYGVAVTAWLAGNHELAIAALREPAITYTETADSAEEMLREISARRRTAE